MSIENRYLVGMGAYTTTKGEDHQKLLMAIAAMLEWKPPRVTRSKPKKKKTTLTIAPEYVQLTLSRSCPGRVALDTYTRSQLSALGKVMQAVTPSLTPQDVDSLVGWINDGGLDFWSTPPTFAHLIKHFPGWLETARKHTPEIPDSDDCRIR